MFLCGVDPYTGQDFSHRKEWILDRMRELAGLFAIEVCGYSVMSNHLHLVLRNRPAIAEQWSDDEIALRWRGFSRPVTMPRLSPSSPPSGIWPCSRQTPNGCWNCASVSATCHGS